MGKRDLSLSERKEGTREKAVTPVVKFELNEIKTHYNESITAVKSQFTIADELLQNGKIIDAEYIWRGQIVFIESAFDFYLHELTKYGLTQIFDENWPETIKFCNIQVDMRSVSKAFREGKDSGWFLEFVNAYYEKDTLVSFESFKDQMKLLGVEVKDVANIAFYNQNETEKTEEKLKRRLNQLYYRRNLIAHQSDRAHEDAQLKEISKELVEKFISDMDKIVNAIFIEMDNM